jgi:NADH-quinone oxidoreductase subunit N
MLLAIASGWHDTQPGGAQHAILYYMAAYVFTAGGALGLIAWLESEGQSVSMESLKGLAQRRPGIAAALAVFMLSLGGMPPLGGFWGKYLVFSCAVRADLIPLAVIGVLMSVIALGYYLRVIIHMYMQPATQTAPAPLARRAGSMLTVTLCAAMVILLGVMPRWFLDLIG